MAARTHKDWLEFLRKAAELPIGYSVDDLLYFKRIAERQYPALAPLVAACIHLAQTSDLEIAMEGPPPATPAAVAVAASKPTPPTKAASGNGHHPRDMGALLRDASLFPRNTDLVRLATRLLPDMRQYRFDKMSRSSIIGKIVDHMETLPARKRSQIEGALREAADASRGDSPAAPSFFSRWEEIIKNLDL